MLAQLALILFALFSVVVCMATGAKAKGTWWWWATFVLLEPHVSVYERIPKKLNRILKYIARWRFMAKT